MTDRIPEELWKLAEDDPIIAAFVALMRRDNLGFDQKVALEIVTELAKRNKELTDRLVRLISAAPVAPMVIIHDGS